MRRHHHTSPAGATHDRLDGVDDDFWAGTADWPTSELPAVAPVDDRHIDGAVDVIEHDPVDAERPSGEVDDLFDDERWDTDWTTTPRRAVGIDPFVLRVGALVVALTLAVPLLLGLRSENDEPASIETGTAASAAVDPTVPDGSAGDADDPATPAAPTEQIEAAAEPAEPRAVGAGDPDTAQAQECALDYEVVEGDFWIRIADGADVELSALLAANDTTVDSPLYPGSSICLPAGAATPPPPVALDASDATSGAVSSGATAAAPAEPVPSPRPSPAPAPVTTPPTTAPATTTPPPPASPSDAVAAIRSVWPDELEERAITIAWRESNHRADAYNGFCCYGLFQIYYDVHRSWLASDLGITSAQQLFDPVLNARAAYRLYERAGGWGPWSQTAY